MNERRQGFLRTVLAGTIASAAPRSTAGPWQPSDEVDPKSLRGGPRPPRCSSSHVVRDNSFALPIDREWRRTP